MGKDREWSLVAILFAVMLALTVAGAVVLVTSGRPETHVERTER